MSHKCEAWLPINMKACSKTTGEEPNAYGTRYLCRTHLQSHKAGKLVLLPARVKSIFHEQRNLYRRLGAIR